jgi:hypothetical protein
MSNPYAINDDDAPNLYDNDIPVPSVTNEYPSTSVSEKPTKAKSTHEKGSHKVFAFEVLFLEENMPSEEVSKNLNALCSF